MKKIMHLFIILSFAFLFSSAQITFQKSFNTVSNGSPVVRQTADGGYIIAGDILVKTDANGDTLWTRNFYFGTSNSAQETFDGGYAISGYTYSFGAGSTDFYLTRTDSSGNILWSKAYGDSSYNEAYAMQQTSDSGFILAGNLWGSNGWDIYIVRTDKMGDTLWTKIIDGAGEDKAATVQQTNDGGFIVAGYTTSFGSAGPDALIIKTDGNGNIEWSKTYNGPGGEFINCIRQITDGGFVFTGHAVNFTTTGQDLFLIKTDSAGIVLWSHFFTNTYNFGNAVEQTGDGGYIITGNAFVSAANGQDVLLVKTDNNGDLLWSRSCGSTGLDAGASVQQTNDGGYIIAGKTTSFGTGLYLIKTDSTGNSGCYQTNISIMQNDSLVSELNVLCNVYSGGTTVTPFTPVEGSGTAANTICSTGITELQPVNSLVIYPNPSSGYFNITTGNKINKGVVFVIDVYGTVIFKDEISNTAIKEIHLRNCSPGIYFVKVSTDNKQFVQKLITEIFSAN